MIRTRLAATCSVCGELWRVDDDSEHLDWLRAFSRRHEEEKRKNTYGHGAGKRIRHEVTIITVIEGDEDALRAAFASGAGGDL